MGRVKRRNDARADSLGSPPATCNRQNYWMTTSLRVRLFAPTVKRAK